MSEPTASSAPNHGGAFSVHHVPLMTPDECAGIVGSCAEPLWNQGRISTERGDGVVAATRRAESIAFHRLVGHAVIVERIRERLHRANREAFRFDLVDFSDADPLVVLRYKAADEAHYAAHTDASAASPERKLSFSVQLSPPDTYVGGNLDVLGVGPMSRRQGDLIVFPSFMAHRVTPVTSGVRHSLVGWMHGPPFR